jgi:hypothetical protein
MRRSSAAGIVFLAMFLLGAVATASAALPEVLVQSGGFPVKFEGTASSGPTRIETVGGVRVECKALKMTGEITSAHAGTYKFDIEHCVAEGGLVLCNTTGDTGGTLLWSGELHLVRVLLSPLKVAMLLSLPKLVGCFGEFGTHENKGFLVLITPLNTFTTKYEGSAKMTAGVQEATAYYNEAGTLVSNAYLELTGGGGIQFGLSSSPINLTMEKTIKIVA